MNFASAERVYVELDWYDGPRGGIADIHGAPHRFKSLFDEAEDEYLGSFLVWPIDDATFALEIEQWHIFVAWNDRYEAGSASSKSHPGHGGIDDRWDDLETQLRECRENTPANAKRARVVLERTEQASRYALTGPDYKLRWQLY